MPWLVAIYDGGRCLGIIECKNERTASDEAKKLEKSGNRRVYYWKVKTPSVYADKQKKEEK